MKKMLRPLRTHWKAIVLVLAAFAAGAILVWFVRPYLAPPAFRTVHDTASGYSLISPFLYLVVPESTQPDYLSLKRDLANAVEEQISDKKVSDMAIYYRSVDSGQWVAINPDHKFGLASMLKVVTVMTVLHKAESDRSILNTRITIDPALSSQLVPQAYAPPTHPLELGKPYTIQDLLWHDIVESDNLAESALEFYVGTDAIKETFAALHLSVPPTPTTDYNTVQEYSHLFRVLYSATYLSREDSQTVLDLLTRTTFDKGLVSGVPTGTIVSHKFGENIVPVTDASSSPVALELHDCGIVYYPGHNYFLCVTTKGDNFDTLAGVIKDISALAWQKTANLPAN